MERMKHLEKELEKSVGEIIIDLQREIRELEKENAKLKEERDSWEKTATKFTNCIDTLEASIKNLQEENRRLKEELDKLKSTYVYDAKQVRDIC